MNRENFMKQLEALLQNVPQAEREEALQYYNDYFDDAGPENEQSVVEALGNPARVAENIKRDLYSNGYSDGSFQQRVANDKAVIPYGTENNKEDAKETQDSTILNNTNTSSTGSGKMSTGMIVLIVLLCIFASPVIVGVLTGILGVLVGVVSGWFGLILGFGVAALALLIAFLVLLVIGILAMGAEPLVGVAIIGIGLLCGGVGILFMMLTVAMAGIATPVICQGTVKLVKKLLSKI